MSLILDALKRAEREHPRDLVQRVGAQPPVMRSRRRGTRVMFLSLALVAGAAAWLWLARTPEPPDPGIVEAVPARQVEALRAAPPLRSALDDVDLTARSDAAHHERPSDAPYLHQLPEEFQHGIPATTLDAHVWSSEPDRRFVMIDMHRYREGDGVRNGLVLVRILEEGAEFEWQGVRFRIGSR